MASRRSSPVALLIISITMPFLAQATSLYVDQSVPSSGDGSSWASAFKTIGEAIRPQKTGTRLSLPEGPILRPLIFPERRSPFVRRIHPTPEWSARLS